MHRERHLPLPVHVRLCLRGIECIRADDMTGRRKVASCRLIRPVRYGLLSTGGNRRMQGIEVRAGKFALIKGMNPATGRAPAVGADDILSWMPFVFLSCVVIFWIAVSGGPACFAARAARQPVSGALCFRMGSTALRPVRRDIPFVPPQGGFAAADRKRFGCTAIFSLICVIFGAVYVMFDGS